MGASSSRMTGVGGGRKRMEVIRQMTGAGLTGTGMGYRSATVLGRMAI